MPAYDLPAELDLADVVVQTQSTVIEETRQRFTLVDEVVHRLGHGRLINELRTLRGYPVVELGENGLRERTTTLGVGDACICVRRGVMRIVEQANEADPNQGALAIHRECIEETSARMRPTARFRKELLELSALEQQPAQVIQINFQLFPLSGASGKVDP
jgi:hypothetical protein